MRLIKKGSSADRHAPPLVIYWEAPRALRLLLAIRYIYMRVTWESAGDRGREAAFALRIGSVLGCLPSLAVRHSPYDVVFSKGDGGQYLTAELKCRSSGYRGLIEREGYMLSSRKWDGLMRHACTRSMALGVSFGTGDDWLMRLVPAREPRRLMRGRTVKKRDDYDEEEVVLIPWSWFTPLKAFL